MKFIRDRMGISEHYFARRWILDFVRFSLRLHHWTGSDDQRALHDHPAWFITLILWGGYDDITESGVEKLRFGSLRFRKAEYAHTVKNVYKNTWTLCIFGKNSRRWSFYPFDGKRMKRDKYFAEYGHHTATDEVIRIRPDGTRI